MQDLTLSEWLIFAGVVSSCFALLAYFKGKVVSQKKWFFWSYASCLLGTLIILFSDSAFQYVGGIISIVGIGLFVSNFVYNRFFSKSNKK